VLRSRSAATADERSRRRDRRARDGTRALSARHGDGEAGQRKAQACGRPLDEPAPRERAEGTADIGFFAADANDDLFERGRRAATSETEEGAEDVDLEAHARELTFSTERPST